MNKKQILIAIPVVLVSYFGTYALLRSLPNTGVVLYAAIALGVCVVLAPAIVGFRAPTCALPGQALEIQRARIRTLTWRTILATTAALAIFPLVFVWNSDMLLVLWFPLAMYLWIFCGVPILRAKDPKRYDPLHPTSADREAKLEPRKRESPVPALAWGVAWGIVSVAGIVVLSVFLKTGDLATVEHGLAAVFFAGLVLFVGPYFSRWWLGRPEPMRSGRKDDLETEYERLRRIKAWWVYAFCLANVVFVLCDGGSFLAGLEHEWRSWIGTFTLFSVVPINMFFGFAYVARIQRISGFLKEVDVK